MIGGLKQACEHVVRNYLPGARLAGCFLSPRRTRRGRRVPMAFYYWHGEKLYCVVFKRDVFRRFRDIYRETFRDLGVSVPSGPGQSMNVELLNDAVRRGKASGGCEMVVVMPDGSVYSYPAKDWLEWAVGHRTIRRTTSEAQAEASIPVCIMKKWESPLPRAATPPELGELERRAEGKQAKLTSWGERDG